MGFISFVFALQYIYTLDDDYEDASPCLAASQRTCTTSKRSHLGEKASNREDTKRIYVPRQSTGMYLIDGVVLLRRCLVYVNIY